jgi:hypothetical protein
MVKVTKKSIKRLNENKTRKRCPKCTFYVVNAYVNSRYSMGTTKIKNYYYCNRCKLMLKFSENKKYK